MIDDISNKGDFSKREFEGLPKDTDYCICLAANTMPGNFTEGFKANAIGPALLMEYCKSVKAFIQFYIFDKFIIKKKKSLISS